MNTSANLLLALARKGLISTTVAREQLAEGDIPQDLHDATVQQLTS